MRASRPAWKVAGVVAIGAVLGTLAGQLLVHQVPFLGHETSVSWHPQFDLGVLKFNLALIFRVNWCTLIGVLAALYVSRKI